MGYIGVKNKDYNSIWMDYNRLFCIFIDIDYTNTI